MRNKNFQPFSNRVAIRMSITISIILNAILLIGYFYNRDSSFDFEQFSFAFITNLVLLYLLYSFNFNIIQRNIKPTRKFWITFAGSFILAFFLNVVTDKLMRFIGLEYQIPHNFILVANLMKDSIIVIIVLLSTYLINSLYQHQQIQIENEKLITENIRIRYEVLKSQVDPHFLFNSLNTLDSLIAIDTDRAHEYVQSLSSVFRYAIGNKEIMQLKEELNFTECYANLMKIRYGNNLHINYKIDSKFMEFYIMPISLQLLVENAIKHNVISNKQPLTIHIENTPNDSIKVWNYIQPKNESESGEGIGLANLTERYKLVFRKEISINRSDIFSVEIPLIKELDSKEPSAKSINTPRKTHSCGF